MKVWARSLSLVLAGALCAAFAVTSQSAAAQDAARKEAKWQGHVVRIDKDHSMIDLHGGPAHSTEARKVAFDDKTRWTKLGKPSTQDEVKDGSFIIVLGHVDDQGILHATRIDLRLPR
ncbi:MAG: hypothetical protein JO159_01965 [Acidobacteria bacterium]|nr:hypothetical protein [Acidobacteriota bacterium]